jgi:hypothetical protein
MSGKVLKTYRHGIPVTKIWFKKFNIKVLM